MEGALGCVGSRGAQALAEECGPTRAPRRWGGVWGRGLPALGCSVHSTGSSESLSVACSCSPNKLPGHQPELQPLQQLGP